MLGSENFIDELWYMFCGDRGGVLMRGRVVDTKGKRESNDFTDYVKF